MSKTTTLHVHYVFLSTFVCLSCTTRTWRDVKMPNFMFSGGRVKRVIYSIFIFNLNKLQILFRSYHYSTLVLWLQSMAEKSTNQSCFIPGISVSFQRSFFYYANWFSLLTMLLSIWCFVSNAIIIIGLFRSGIRSLCPRLLMVCSLAFSDLLWGSDSYTVKRCC